MRTRLFILLGTASALSVGAEELSQDQMQEILRTLQQSYVNPKITEPDELNRAAIAGLLARHPHGAALVDKKTDEAAKAVARKLVHDTLADSVAYLRPGSFLAEELPQLDIALDSLAKTKVTTLLLDLRSPACLCDVQAAGEFLGRFLPKRETAFTLRKPAGDQPVPMKGKQRWTGRLILLVDSETNNGAEIIAAMLKSELKPTVFGSATAGRTAQFKDLPVGDSQLFRYAEARAILADGSSLFGAGLKPDMAVDEDFERKHAVFTKSETEGVKKFVFDTQRPRFSEASLVAGTAPELDYQIAKSANQSTVWDEVPLQDLVIQAVMDFLTAEQLIKEQEEAAKAAKSKEDAATEEDSTEEEEN